MLNAFNEREQLERLHDRHKRFSLDVYDHHTKNNKEKLEESKKNLKETEEALQQLKEKLHS
ncbi:hypothetical protein [Pontimicrobium sp. MEBiC01747]